MAAHLPIPVHSTLDKIYSDASVIAQQAERWNHLSDEFAKRFGTKPTHIVRAPGRVNLIGDHIDYALFGVFPAAVERDILIATAPSSRSGGTIRVENLDTRYSGQQFAAERGLSQEWRLSIDTTKLSWESYVKAGYFGVLNQFFGSEDEGDPRAFDLLVTGSVPAGSGLSSSAAMVVASSLSFLVMNGKLQGMTKRALVEMAMENERRVGVNSGGMDQAASVISNSSSALYITFHPYLEAEPVLIPASTNLDHNPVFIIANSLVVSDKAVSAKTQYNLRVIEILVSARVLAKALNVEVGPKEKITLREVLDRWVGMPDGHYTNNNTMKDGLLRILGELECLKPMDNANNEEGLTIPQMIEASGLSETEFYNLYLSWVEVEATHFHLYRRAKHVYAEALRVLQFREACVNESIDAGSDALLRRLGQLMNESQTSCAELCDSSCPELNDLTALACASGAYGSRVTGAGWGGCTVSLVAESNVGEFIARLRNAYGPYRNMVTEDLDQVLFASKPGSGACAGISSIEDNRGLGTAIERWYHPVTPLKSVILP